MKILRSLQIMKNSRENCLLGKIFVHIMNLCLWFILFSVVFLIVFVPAEPMKKFCGFFCILAFFVDFLFMSAAEPVPVLDNPFRKAPATINSEPENVIDTEESFRKALAAGKDDSSKINISAFD